MPTSTDVSQRAPHIRGITPKELEGLVAVMKLTETVADKVRSIIYISIMLCNVLLCKEVSIIITTFEQSMAIW